MMPMPSEHPGRRKFSKLMTHHVFSNIYRNVLPTIMNGQSMTNHLGEYG